MLFPIPAKSMNGHTHETHLHDSDLPNMCRYMRVVVEERALAPGTDTLDACRRRGA